MSDFDREAEREKLREKYERDKQKREASERMSELLLQGATMTNRHCPACQSPVFRYDGRSFCPTCEREVTEEGELLDDDGTGATAADSSADAGGSAAPGDDRDTGETATSDPTPGRDVEGGEAGPDPDERAEQQPEGPAQRATETGGGADERRPEPAESAPPTPSRDRRPARVDPPATGDSEPPAERGEADGRAGGDDSRRTRRQAERARSERGTLRDAEARLVGEVASLTRRAEETRDVGRKRDLLAAAREAAETLETVRRL